LHNHIFTEATHSSVQSTTIADMPTFENQKEESPTTEARRADNRGPTTEARWANKLKSSRLGERCKLPHWGLGRSPSQFLLWCSFSFTDGLWW